MPDLKRKGVFTFLTKGTDTTRRDIGGVTKGVQDLDKASQKAGKSLGAMGRSAKGMARDGKGSLDFLKKLTRGKQEAAKASGGLISKLGGLKGSLAKLVVGYGVLKATQKAMRWAEEAARVQNLSLAYDSMSKSVGVVSRDMLEDMKAATRGTVTEMELMQRANLAMMLDVPVDRMGDVMEVARSAALATGQSTSYMVESLTVALARQSKLWLDNLGIVFDSEQAMSRYAVSVGKTVDALTDQERKLAFVNAALDAGVKNAERIGLEGTTAVEGFGRLRASLSNLGVALSSFLVHPLSLAAGYAADIVEYLTPGGGLDFGSLDLTDPQQLAAANQAQRVAELLGVKGPLDDAAQKFIDGLNESIARANYRPSGKVSPIVSAGAAGVPAIFGSMLQPGQAAEYFETVSSLMVTEGTPIIEGAFEELSPVTAKAFLESLAQQDEQFRGYFSGLARTFMENGKVNWEEYSAWMVKYIQETYGEGAEGVDILRRFREFLANEMPEAAKTGVVATISSLKDLDYAVQGLGDAFAGLIMGNKLALKEGMIAIAAEAAARLKAVAASASIEALYEGAKAIARLAIGDFTGAAEHGKAAAAFAATAAAAGVAAGAVARSFGTGQLPGYGRPEHLEARDAEGRGGFDSSRGGVTTVTRTAPTSINVTINNFGSVYYGSESHATADAIQEALDTGAVPSQEVA